MIDTLRMRTATFVLMTVFGLASPPLAVAAITWDGEGNSNWWFDPANWSSEGDLVIPPAGLLEEGGFETTDSQVNIGTGGWDVTGEGVVYDPDNDPFFAAAANLQFPAGSGPQQIFRFYVGRDTDVTNVVTLKSGDLEANRTIIGRSGGPTNLSLVVQDGASFELPAENLSIAAREESGIGNGIWDYRSGSLNVAVSNGEGIRLSVQSNEGGGTGGHGRFIMHNPDSGGFVRTWQLRVAAGGAGDGVDTGVGIMEYHYENGGTRPVQVVNSIGSLTSVVIGNGASTDGSPGVRSSRLELNLAEAPTIDGEGIPTSLGLISIEDAGQTLGVAGMDGGMFSSADGSVLYEEGDTVSATFAGVTYDWTISYTGDITWSDMDNSVVDAIGETGTGNDIVLIGLGSSGLSGDFNDDGVVDAIDYTVWRDGLVDPFDATSDYNSDMLVNFDDFATWKSSSQAGYVAGEYDAWAANYGAVGGLSSAIPEPAALLLALVAFAAGSSRRS